MIDQEINPFQELYVTDSPDPKAFVHLFSDIPVRHTQFLFREGNVVLKGSQGSGKSMLLNLFRPNIRLAYSNAGKEFPVPCEWNRFVGAGINLTRSGAYDIGQLTLLPTQDDSSLYPLYFGDFVNYSVVRDIAESITIMATYARSFDNIVHAEHLDSFAQTLAKDDCWFSWLSDCHDFETLKKRLDARIHEYRKFHNYNIPAIDESIHETKTSIGEPIARTAEVLKSSGVLDVGTPVFIQIDELHRLYGSDTSANSLGTQFRRVINKAVGLRDSRVSYRIGTRPYAWEDDLLIYGTTDQIEDKRDFQIVNLEELLQRREDKSTWIFPDFAEDAFRRRLEHAGHETSQCQSTLMKSVFGAGVVWETMASDYAGSGNPNKILKLPKDWPTEWRTFLLELFKRSPLDACLAAAWARQTGGAEKAGDRLKKSPPVNNPPWSRAIWRKERIRQCLLQIAARNQQRLKWSGSDQILALSSGNISVFLSICYEIWQVHLRRERRKRTAERLDPVCDTIHPAAQTIGIQEASDSWYRKITELPDGDDRQAFVDVLGRKFRSWLIDDEAMSYPGHNGFSVEDYALNAHPGLMRFLRDAANYGALSEIEHTTKENSRKKRTKWYLSPILSPHFQIPESHVKEPKYLRDVIEISKWLHEARIVNGQLQPLLDLYSEREHSVGKTDYRSTDQLTFDGLMGEESDC